MGLTELIFGIAPVEIRPSTGFFGTITLDASVHENHHAAAKATRHPVEAEHGQSDISDHVQVEPLSVQIEGVISNHPAEFLASAVYLGQDRAQDAYGELLYKLINGQPCTIVTTLNTYDNMLLELLEVPRDAGKGNALYFNATATQVSFIELQGEIGASVGGSTKNAGAVKAKAASAGSAAKAQSAVSKLTGIR